MLDDRLWSGYCVLPEACAVCSNAVRYSSRATSLLFLSCFLSVTSTVKAPAHLRQGSTYLPHYYLIETRALMLWGDQSGTLRRTIQASVWTEECYISKMIS
jgi:hypothetical protein